MSTQGVEKKISVYIDKRIHRPEPAAKRGIAGKSSEYNVGKRGIDASGSAELVSANGR